MTNRVIIDRPKISNHRIDYSYTVEGEWENAFKLEEAFFVEYSCDISSVPEGVAVVPLLAGLLPMAWVYDAEIVVPVCDRDFFECAEEVKKGYAAMYPSIAFKGKLTASALFDDYPEKNGGAAAFFSGGVDAFNTLIQHAEEKPTLLTLWGSDVKLTDETGWKILESHIAKVAADFQTDFITIKSCFRRFLSCGVLSKKVEDLGDGWWHGFQHGIGVISHAAPVVYLLGKRTVYFASTYTAAEAGKVASASDPTIDNHVRFAGARVQHDGYQYTRQMKVQNITRFSRETGMKVALRVCWESTGCFNCCDCEKCWRTILAIYAENLNPREYGFEYSDRQLKRLSQKIRYGNGKAFRKAFYRPIQEAMRKNCSPRNLPGAIRWFYYADVTRLNRDTPYKMCIRQARRVMRKVVSLKNQWGERLWRKKS